MKKRPQDLTGRNEKYLKKLIVELDKRVKALESDMKVLRKHFKFYIGFE